MIGPYRDVYREFTAFFNTDTQGNTKTKYKLVPEHTPRINNRPDELLHLVIDGRERERWSNLDEAAGQPIAASNVRGSESDQSEGLPKSDFASFGDASYGAWRRDKMSRPLRMEYPGAWYHAMNRRSLRESIFLGGDDHLSFRHVSERGAIWTITAA